MPNYHRYRVPGGCYFLTVNLLERSPIDTLIRHVDVLRAVVRDVRRRWPFVIDGWVVLLDHLHCIWAPPSGDTDFTNRWRLIKAGFARQLPKTERRSLVRTVRGERGVWQRRFWEHAIRDELSRVGTKCPRGHWSDNSLNGETEQRAHSGALCMADGPLGVIRSSILNCV